MYPVTKFIVEIKTWQRRMEGHAGVKSCVATPGGQMVPGGQIAHDEVFVSGGCLVQYRLLPVLERVPSGAPQTDLQ